jgi:glycosyltransferase involved in cell wall biosynthesis
LRAVINRVGFGLVHLNDSPLLAAAWLAHRRRIPVVWHLRSAPPNEGKDRRSRLLRRAILRLSDATIAINSDVAALWGVDARVIPNSVEIDQLRPGDKASAREALDLPKDRPIVACFGFLYPSKGFREFISAAARLSQDQVEATFLIVGGGVRSDEFFRRPVGRLLRVLGLAPDYAAEARRLVAEAGLEEQLRFIPFTRRPHDLFRASDLVVAPSQGPEIGRPVLEGAASGVTVVCTGSHTGGGILRPGETTLFLDSFEPETLAETIRQVLADDERRGTIGGAARRHAVKMFDPARNARLVEGLYQSVTRPRERTRVLYVHHRPQLGGAPLSLAYLIRRLGPDFEPHVLCPAGPAAELFERSGATVHRGPISMFVHVWDAYQGLRWALLVRELALLPGHLRALHRILREGQFDLVHLNESTLLPAGLLAHRLGLKVVWHLRTALVNDGRDRRSRMIASVIDRTAAAVVAIDDDVASRFPLRTPIRLIPNSAEIPLPDPLPSLEAKLALGLQPDVPAIGFFGFIRRHKGWPTFVEAARLMVERGAEAQFVVLGGGVRPPEYFRSWRGKLVSVLGVLSDEESALHDLVDREGLSDRFHFSSFVTQTENVYRALDLIAFPNQAVGLGRPVIEAAAHGRPVVASGSVSGAGILIPGVTGILVARDRPEALADALLGLLADPERRARMGKAAHALAAERFDPERSARAVEALYRDVLGSAAVMALQGKERDMSDRPRAELHREVARAGRE